MGFKDAAVSGLFNYFTFSYRSSRSEYWYFILFTFLLALVTSAIDMIVFSYTQQGLFNTGPTSVLLQLFLFIPGLSIAVRRLHDIGRSGWWIFIGVIPIIGLIIYIYWLCKKGDAGPNEYGDDPLNEISGVFA